MKKIKDSFRNLLTEPVFKVFGLVICFGLILSIIYYASLINQNFSQVHTIAGQIVSASGNQIEIQNRSNSKAVVIISDQTKIKIDPIYLSGDLQVGMFVLVTGSTYQPGVFKAHYIQGIKPPKNEK